MSNYHGSCLCGRVRYQLNAVFQSFFLCHCHRCQKDTGSLHAANLFAPGAELVWLQGLGEVQVYQHEHTLHSKAFCRHCGSALPLMAEALACVVVPAGSLDNAVDLQPTARIFMDDCAEWGKALSDVTAFSQLPYKE
jgi:hypothetical protein